MTPILEARRVTKTYETDGQPVHAVRDLDFTVDAGEFAAVMGPSGCGKSTLLHLLGGLTTPTTGEVLVSGASLATMSDDERADVRRNHVGYVFQAYNLVPVLTVAENIALPTQLAGVAEAERRTRVDALLEAMGLGPKRDKRPAQLSGGEQQRVAIARALVMRPSVLLADEPTGNLDSATGRQVLQAFVELHRSGQSIVLVTHDAKIATRAQRVQFMQDGTFVGETNLELAPEGDATQLLARMVDAELSP